MPSFFNKAKQYDIRGKGYLKTNAKYFIVDNGLRRHAIGKKGANYTNRLENIVFIELLRRGYTVDVGKLDSKKLILSPEKPMKFYMYKSPLKSLKIPTKQIIFCILKITIKKS